MYFKSNGKIDEKDENKEKNEENEKRMKIIKENLTCFMLKLNYIDDPDILLGYPIVKSKGLGKDKIELYGPMPSMVYKVKNRYRMNIFIKGNKKEIDKFKKILKFKLEDFKDPEIRITIDIDPINLL